MGNAIQRNTALLAKWILALPIEREDPWSKVVSIHALGVNGWILDSLPECLHVVCGKGLKVYISFISFQKLEVESGKTSGVWKPFPRCYALTTSKEWLADFVQQSPSYISGLELAFRRSFR